MTADQGDPADVDGSVPPPRPADPGSAADRARRMRMPALALIAAGAGLAWLTSASLAGWVRPVALLALAGAGALLAAQGWLRRTIGGLIVLAGVGLLVSGGLWPALAGVAVLAGGVLAVRFGAGWPGMSARYDRARPVGGARSGPDEARHSTQQVWDALDRGEDPSEAEWSTSDGSDRR